MPYFYTSDFDETLSIMPLYLRIRLCFYLMYLCTSDSDYESVWYISVRLTLVTNLSDVAPYVWFWLQICLIYLRMCDSDYGLFDILRYVWLWLWTCLIWRRSMILSAVFLYFRIWIRLSDILLHVRFWRQICLIYFCTSDSDHGSVRFTSIRLTLITDLSDIVQCIWYGLWVCPICFCTSGPDSESVGDNVGLCFCLSYLCTS